jgi:cell wall-associated NlpC family hydrolase
VNSAKAGGPMQFLQPTFDSVVARHPIPPGGAHPPSRYNPHDAIFAYNHAEWYVRKYWHKPKSYAGATSRQDDCTSVRAPSRAAQAAIKFACDQCGLPCVWGGNGPAGGDAGFDCSGLTKTAYAAAGIDLPRTAQTQYNGGVHVPEPGDLVFFGSGSTRVTHVGLVVSKAAMINAPEFGRPVRLDPIGRHVIGATRPAFS